MKFETKLYQTSGVNAASEADSVFAGEIQTAINKYFAGDWGDTCESDKKCNNQALKNGARIVAKYKTTKGEVLIITEVNRAITTILFAREY